MNKSLNTQVLIIGGGPSGSACAIKCRQRGIECIVADKAAFPRNKLCGGLLTNKTRNAMRNLLGEDGMPELLNEAVVNTTDHFSILYGYDVIAKCTPQSPMQLVSRVKMDNYLFCKAKALGANCIDGDGLQHIDFDTHTATLESGTTISYQYLVAADGAASKVEVLLKRAAKDFKPKGNNALVAEVDAQNKDVADSETLGIHFGLTKRGYAWTFPRGEYVTYGLAKPFNLKVNIKDELHRFMQGVKVRNIESYKVIGCMIPYHNMMKEPVWHEHVLFAGDAAGLVDPLTGEGICHALQSGIHAANAIWESINNGANLSKTYKEHIKPIQSMIKSGGMIEKLMSNSIFMKFIKNNAHKHLGFMNFFYDEFVDNGSTDSYLQMKARWEKVKAERAAKK